MSEYLAPLKEMRFVMQELAGLDQVVALPGCEEASPDVVDAILEEAARFAGEVLSPLNRVGDRDGAKWKDTVVTTSPGFKEAYRQFVDNGWNGLGCDPEFGGQGLPKLLSTAVSEMWKAANHAFSLCPMLTQGAIEALMIAGTDKQKAAYLPNLVSGDWTGTMNLTEPSAGSDLAAVRSRAEPVGDGTYRIFGQKIFITYGEHDMTDNIVHLVLARTPNAPEGVKGISLFVVPKFLLNADGTPGERNDVYCVSIEHKLGIHGSPTAVLAFGDNGGAIGTLVGEENRGLEYMFIMMNAARFNVGLEGLGDAERAYQRAVAYARDRVQGTEVGVRGGPKVPIIKHPDVRRMLLSMRARIEAMRALAYVTASAQDNAHANQDGAVREKARAFADLLIPVVKGWSTESAIDIASLGVQVHGGMGYIEETGAAQHLRDARITAIYEGTTAIQANDLIGRKIAREKGATIMAVIADMRAVATQLDGDLAVIGARQSAAVDALERAVSWLVANFSTDPKAAHAGAVPFLHLFGIVAGGWQMGRAAVIARSKIAAGETDPFWAAKLATTRFYADHFLTQASGLAESVVAGATGSLELAEDSF
ncbi:acyl-CoA dehydrogenase [Ferribacterium limneticum]|uniref:acyl-CoA dehydrogenase n=1 Tax=Ferribacterium limneticum TaxID=76259 RepID=UPI001CFC3016|nr:acyl-CoA dehydrogenase family protein [Ferribacterium limneticum]UCV18302.1 acyl-CoA dehydrogenase [Ferribacterium limneticum]